MPVYFKITNYDGDPSVQMYSEKQLLEEINQEGFEPKFVTREDLEKNSDPNYWGEYAVLIIKGEVVVPQEKQKVTEWTFKKG